MIKVKDTKTHKTNIIVKHDLPYIALVTDAELVLVEKEFGDLEEGYIKVGKYEPKWVKPILISRTEKIEVGDWYLDLEDKESINPIYQRNQIEDSVYKQCAKILALPEHFSPESLQDIVDGKLKEGKCLVECEKDEESMGKLNWLSQIKLNPHITIYSVEEKMYTIKEIVDELKYGLSQYGCKLENHHYHHHDRAHVVHNHSHLSQLTWHKIIRFLFLSLSY